jgi:hypothetical protein
VHPLAAVVMAAFVAGLVAVFAHYLARFAKSFSQPGAQAREDRNLGLGIVAIVALTALSYVLIQAR